MKPTRIASTNRKTTRKKSPLFSTSVATFLLAAFWTTFDSTLGTLKTAAAIDFSINYPISRLFGGGVSDKPLDENANADAAGAESNFAASSVDRPRPIDSNLYRRETPPATAASRSVPPDENATPTPLFSKRLPYCAVLGKVVCEANFPLDSVDGLEEEITRLHLDLVGYLGVPEARETIELCLFRDQGSYIDFIGSEFPTAPLDRPALYVKANGPGVLMIPRDAQMIVNIRHEMTHAYLNASLRNVPIWIDEGLAKYFETPPGERGFRNPFLKLAERDASGFFGAPPSLERLEKLTRVDQMRTREYRESWSWVHFMLHYSNDSHRVLAFYLKSLRPEEQAGVSTKEAYKRQKKAPMKRLLEKYLPDYEQKYVEHFRGWDVRRDAYESARAEAARVDAVKNVR